MALRKMKVSRSKLLDLLRSLGYKVADKWTKEKLLGKIKRLPEWVKMDSAGIKVGGSQKLLDSLVKAVEAGRNVEIVNDVKVGRPRGKPTPGKSAVGSGGRNENKKRNVAGPPESAAKAVRGQKGSNSKRMSGLDAVLGILSSAKEPISCSQLVDKIMGGGQWTTESKRPYAALRAKIMREINNKGDKSRIKRTGLGLFSINK